MKLRNIGHVLKSRISKFFLISLLWFTADYLLEFNFPTYLESVGKTYFEIGLFISLGSLGGLLIDLPLGTLSDRVSRKKLLLTGLVILVIGSGIILKSILSVYLIIGFLTWSVGFEIWKIPRDAIFASATDKEKRSQQYGLDLQMTYLGQTIGPILGGFVLLLFGYNGIISSYAVIMGIVFMIILFFIHDNNHEDMTDAIQDSLNIHALKTEWKEFKSMGLTGFFLFFLALLLTAWEQILLTMAPLFYGPDALNLPPDMGGVFLACFSLPGIFLAYYTGKLADKTGKGRILFTGLALLGTTLILLSFSSRLSIVLTLALIISMGWALALPALNGFMIDLTYKHQKGKICGIWNLFRNIGFIIGPVLGGFIAQMTGLRNTFMIFGIIIFLTALIFLLFSKGIIKTSPTSS